MSRRLQPCPCHKSWLQLVSDCLLRLSHSLINISWEFARQPEVSLALLAQYDARTAAMAQSDFELYDVANDLPLGLVNRFWTAPDSALESAALHLFVSPNLLWMAAREKCGDGRTGTSLLLMNRQTEQQLAFSVGFPPGLLSLLSLRSLCAVVSICSW